MYYRNNDSVFISWLPRNLLITKKKKKSIRYKSVILQTLESIITILNHKLSVEHDNFIILGFLNILHVILIVCYFTYHHFRQIGLTQT